MDSKVMAYGDVFRVAFLENAFGVDAPGRMEFCANDARRPNGFITHRIIGELGLDAVEHQDVNQEYLPFALIWAKDVPKIEAWLAKDSGESPEVLQPVRNWLLKPPGYQYSEYDGK